ncbi:reverse transcriptase domain-containing protein [Tanacetum coccineum]
MPFGLKNVRATYQRLVDTIFEGQMGRNLEAYVDGMVIKSKTELEMIKDVEETLMTLKKSESGKNKGCNEHALTEQPETNATTKWYANKKDFHWTTEAEESFQAMKKLIAELPTLIAPRKEEELMKEKEYGRAEDTVPEKPDKSLAEQVYGKLYTNRASNEHGSGAGLILIDPEGVEYSYTLQLNFTNSNNGAEYEALLAGLRIATKMKIEKMHAFVDSKLVVNQVEGSYEAKGKNTNKYKEKVLEIIRSFSNFRISHIPREENRKAEALSKLAAVQCEGLTKGVLIEELNEQSVDMAEVNAIIEEATRTWMTPIQEYKKHGILPKDAVEA